MSSAGYLLGAFVGQFIIYALLVWLGGGWATAHPFRRIVGFNLIIAFVAMLSDAYNGQSSPVVRLAAALIVASLLIIGEIRRPAGSSKPPASPTL